MGSYWDPKTKRHVTYTELTGRGNTSIKTHDSVSVSPGGNNSSDWKKCEDIDSLELLLQTDNDNESSYVNVQWSFDGVNQHGLDNSVISNSAGLYRNGSIPVKAPYFRVIFVNPSANTVAQVVSIWSYLKV